MLQKMSRRRRFRTCRRPVKKNDPKSKIEPNDHYQIVDIRLYFNLEGLKPNKYYKNIKKTKTSTTNKTKYFRAAPSIAMLPYMSFSLFTGNYLQLEW